MINFSDLTKIFEMFLNLCIIIIINYNEKKIQLLALDKVTISKRDVDLLLRLENLYGGFISLV